MPGTELSSGAGVKIPCMAKVALMTTFTLSFSVSLPASRSCRQRNGGLLSSLHGLRPVLHLAIEGSWGREDFAHCVDTHSFSHTQPLEAQGHNNHRRQGSTSKGLQSVCILTLSASVCILTLSVCVLCWCFKVGWVSCDSHGLHGDNPMSLSVTNQHSTIMESVSLSSPITVYPVKLFVRHLQADAPAGGVCEL